jgi:hypothetical protein
VSALWALVLLYPLFSWTVVWDRWLLLEAAFKVTRFTIFLLPLITIICPTQCPQLKKDIITAMPWIKALEKL